MTLDDDELEILSLALQHLRDDCATAPDDRLMAIHGKRCCRHVASKCLLLQGRISQEQTDRRNGDA